MEITQDHGVKRVLIKLEKSINSGNYYEAHQMYRTLYFRYLGQKKYSSLIELLYNGSHQLLQKEQHTSGADLGILLVDVLQKADITPSQPYFEKLINLFALMSSTTPERETFVQNALRWSTKGSNFKTGHPDLHQKLAEVYWKEKNYTLSRQHYLYTSDGQGCAKMLIELHENQGFSNEIDLFITQTVLQYLCLKNKAAANKVFKSYVSLHPKIKKNPPYTRPLLNFLYFILKVVESGKLTVFTILCEHYLTSLNTDPSFLQYINKISQIYFNVQPPQNYNNRGGLLSTFLQSFFNDLDNEDGTEDKDTAISYSQDLELKKKRKKEKK